MQALIARPEFFDSNPSMSPQWRSTSLAVAASVIFVLLAKLFLSKSDEEKNRAMSGYTNLLLNAAVTYVVLTSVLVVYGVATAL